MEPWYRDRAAIVAAVAAHGSLRAVARATGVGNATLRKWLDPDSWRTADRRYCHSEKGRATGRRYAAARRARRRQAGLCPSCGREPAFGLVCCDRCGRYFAEHKWLGHSTVPLAKGVEG